MNGSDHLPTEEKDFYLFFHLNERGPWYNRGEIILVKRDFG